MQIDKRSRAELKLYYVRNAIPTESNFAEFIDAMLNQREDGVAKLPNDALSVEAAGDDASQKKAINFYSSFSDANPTWTISLNPRQDPANAATAKAGFSISDATGVSHLFIERNTGNVGLGTIGPLRAGLQVDQGATNNLALLLTSSGAGWGSGLRLENTAAGSPKTFGIYTGGGMLHFADVNNNVDRLVITSAGDLGVGISPSGAKLQVAGTVKANRFMGDNTLVLNDYTTANPSSNVNLYSPPNDRDTWLYLDSADTGSNWGIYHRQIDSTVKSLPANSIGFIGGGASKLQAYIGLQTGNAYFAGDVGIGNPTPGAALDITTDSSTWNGWLEAIRFSRPEHSAITHPGGKLLFGMHSDRNFYFADTNAGRHLAIISCADGGRLGIGANTAPGAALDITANGLTWGGWLEAIRFSRAEHSAISHPGGQLLFGMHGNRNFYFADTKAGRYVMQLSADSGLLTVPGGAVLNAIGIGTQTRGATTWPYETIQMDPGNNLRIWYGTTERFIFWNNGALRLKFDNGYWEFQTDGNLVKYNNAGTPLWALNMVSGKAGWS